MCALEVTTPLDFISTAAVEAAVFNHSVGWWHVLSCRRMNNTVYFLVVVCVYGVGVRGFGVYPAPKGLIGLLAGTEEEEEAAHPSGLRGSDGRQSVSHP